MAGKKENAYQGISIALLLAAPSGLQGDLRKLWEAAQVRAGLLARVAGALEPVSLTEDETKLKLKQARAEVVWTFEQAVRHVLYHQTSAFGPTGFSPQTPSNIDCDIEHAISEVNFISLAADIETFFAAGEAIHGVVGTLMDYSDGSCPRGDHQPLLHRSLRTFGAILDGTVPK